MLGKLKNLISRRHYWLAKLGFYPVPASPLASYPDGLTVTKVLNTGITVVDNFCTAEEAQHFITQSAGLVERSRIVDKNNKLVEHSGRTSHNAFVRVDPKDPVMQSIVFRAASLFGLPCSYVEKINFTRYEEGQFYKTHLDFNDSYTADRLYTCLIYLNDLDESQGGGTWFPSLNLVASPKRGRAVTWLNKNPDGSGHFESHHAALPPRGEDSEKWVIQLWFRGYPYSTYAPSPLAESVGTGQALVETDELPGGVALAGSLTEDNAYGPGSD